jgi:hypothetical protein
MSYLQLEIDGVKRGLKFNQMAMVILSQKTDKDNAEATAGYALFYAGLKANCFVKQIEADFTFEDSCNWFDKLTNEQVLKISEAFNSTQEYLKDLPKEKPTDKKKVKKNTGVNV